LEQTDEEGLEKMALKVVLADYGSEYIPESLDVVRAAGMEVVDAAACPDPEAAVLDADALVAVWYPVTAEVISRLKHCRVIIRRGIGVDTVDLDAAAERGIPVCNVPDYCVNEVADHAFSLALALVRQLPQLDRTLREGSWKHVLPYEMPSLEAMTFGVAGFGRIGRAVLRRAAACCFRTAAYDPFVPDAELAQAGVARMGLEELFKQCDVISLHTPLTPETKHMVNAARLASMKPNAILVNTSRGPLIDTVALADALNRRVIGAAGLDVFETEPLEADHPIRRCPNALLTPHFAWHSRESIKKLHIMGLETAVRALRGEKLNCIVNGVQPQPGAQEDHGDGS